MDLAGFDSDYINLMAQVGATAFALMFAAVQFRWKDWSSTRLGKLAAGTALLELLTVTLVSIAVLTGWAPFWVATALAAAAAGLVATNLQRREFRDQRGSGYFPTPADSFQMGASWLPFVSYGLLALSAIAWTLARWWPALFEPHLSASTLMSVVATVVSVDLAWFIFSGLTETLVTLSPHLLDPEEGYEIDSIPLPESATFALQVRRVAGTRATGLPRVEGENDSLKRVVLLPEIWGVTPDVLRIAKGLADLGYLVMTPDYYRGRGGLGSVLKANAAIGDAIKDAAQMAVEAKSILNGGGPSPVDVVGLSMGATAALKQPASWRRLAAFYPEDPGTSASPMPAANALIFLAAREKPQRLADNRETDMRATYEEAAIEVVQARHSFLGGRSAPVMLRPLLLVFRRTAYNRAASDSSWRKLQAFLK
jgi:dienelactone hydrolase